MLDNTEKCPEASFIVEIVCVRTRVRVRVRVRVCI